MLEYLLVVGLGAAVGLAGLRAAGVGLRDKTAGQAECVAALSCAEGDQGGPEPARDDRRRSDAKLADPAGTDGDPAAGPPMTMLIDAPAPAAEPQASAGAPATLMTPTGASASTANVASLPMLADVANQLRLARLIPYDARGPALVERIREVATAVLTNPDAYVLRAGGFNDYLAQVSPPGGGPPVHVSVAIDPATGRVLRIGLPNAYEVASWRCSFAGDCRARDAADARSVAEQERMVQLALLVAGFAPFLGTALDAADVFDACSAAHGGTGSGWACVIAVGALVPGISEVADIRRMVRAVPPGGAGAVTARTSAELVRAGALSDELTALARVGAQDPVRAAENTLAFAARQGIQVVVSAHIVISARDLERIRAIAARPGGLDLEDAVSLHLGSLLRPGGAHPMGPYHRNPSTGTVHVAGGFRLPDGVVDARIERLLADAHARLVLEEVAHGAGAVVRPGSYTALTPRVAAFEQWLGTEAGAAWVRARFPSSGGDVVTSMRGQIREVDIMEILGQSTGRFSAWEIDRYDVRRAYDAWLRRQPGRDPPDPPGALGVMGLEDVF